MSKSIVFITFAPLYEKEGQIASDAASARYRVIMPAHQLARRGYGVEVAQRPQEGWNLSALEGTHVDTIVFSKAFMQQEQLLAQFLKQRGTRIVFDICDNWFDHPKHGQDFRTMCGLADDLVASTESMANIIRENTQREAIVISDPLEGNKRDAHFSPHFPRVKLLWFGHPTNLDSLEQALPDLTAFGQKTPLALSVVTTGSPHLDQLIRTHNQEHGDCLLLTHTAWNTDSTWAELEKTDIVIIPSLKNSRKSVKSPNRLIESIWAGRFVVANPVPSYLPYEDFAWLGGKLSDGILYAINNGDVVLNKIAAGQQAIAGPHSTWQIGNQWEQILAGKQDRPLRLNLGCGDKILPDYVNVDIVASRRGMRPDVLCDLHKLTPFSDNSVDEILSVHVVEHFWRWEVRDILREWVRILKPGGRMILECPNLESACRTFLEDPATRAREDQQGQRTMWVFYGDPAWKDPYMIHRWGYTPLSLAELLTEIGLVEIKQEPAQFKLREPRDMRITGKKSL